MISKEKMVKIKCNVCGKVTTSLFNHEGTIHDIARCGGTFRKIEE